MIIVNVKYFDPQKQTTHEDVSLGGVSNDGSLPLRNPIFTIEHRKYILGYTITF
jgi:hypothetical protein